MKVINLPDLSAKPKNLCQSCQRNHVQVRMTLDPDETFWLCRECASLGEGMYVGLQEAFHQLRYGT